MTTPTKTTAARTVAQAKPFRSHKTSHGGIVINRSGETVYCATADEQSGFGGPIWRAEKARASARRVARHMNEIAADPKYGEEYAAQYYCPKAEGSVQS